MKKLIMSLCASVILFAQPVFAEVITLEKTEGYSDYLYVAGDSDNYPIEYYDNEVNAYCGIIPDILGIVSEKTGMNFAYINGGGQDRAVMGENLQVDIVSSASENTTWGASYLELVSYSEADAINSAGIIFTDIIGDDEISAITSAIGTISHQEKNGIYISYASEETEVNYLAIIILAFVLILISALALVLFRRVKRLKAEYESDKMTDAETGMGNQQFFKYHFRYTLGDVSRSLYHVAYIIIDSSYLRSYYGDSSFDEVVKYTALVLSEYTGDREISARISESGFAFAFQSPNREDAEKRLAEIINKLNKFDRMTEKTNKPVFHVAVYPLSGSDRNCELLLFNLRKNCVRITDSDKQLLYCDEHLMNVVQEEKKLTESILTGLEKNEFKMYLQFVVDSRTKNIVSAEALSRWDSHEKGLITPDKYIGNMENAGLIARHDFHMFEQACRLLERWNGTEYGHISVSCNFTRITLSEKNFVDKLAMISDSYKIDLSKLSIEITEDAMEKDTETATENVRKCKQMGLNIYLDDLGSGYTSLVNLCDYPIDVVKIDRNVLLKTDSPKGRELFSGIVALAHSLSTKVICEGVETEEQYTLALHSDCDYVQGWYFSKPFPLEECEEFIVNYNKKL